MASMVSLIRALALKLHVSYRCGFEPQSAHKSAGRVLLVEGQVVSLARSLALHNDRLDISEIFLN